MKITREQIEQLTPGQQDTLASIELQHAMRRQRLLKQAGHYRAMSWLPWLVILVVNLIATSGANSKYEMLASLAIPMILFGLIQFHATGVNRRLDALIDLLEPDKKGNVPMA